MKKFPPLLRIFAAFVVGLVALMALTFEPAPPFRLDPVDFWVAEPDALFFKNMRRYYYAVEERPEEDVELLRFKKGLEPNTPLRFAIFNNWRMDEAYIIPEPDSNLLVGDSLIVRWELEEDSGFLRLGPTDNLGFYFFAGELFFKLERQATLSLQQADGSYQPWPGDAESLRHLRTSLKDYFRLVGKL